jgi:glycosidase
MITGFQHRLFPHVRARFARLYGEARADRCLERFSMLIGRYGVLPPASPAGPGWDERDAVLIAYGDMIRRPPDKPLACLRQFLENRIGTAFRTVHLLPFFPYSSDDGFSVIHYRTVNPDLGSWPDIQQLGQSYRLLFDLVLNHVSRQSGWFRDFETGVAPARDYFIAADPGSDLSAVVRPRRHPLLSPVQTRGGRRHLWTTFSDDQIDLNFANPDLLFEMLDILLYYVSLGASTVRLDAIAYLWKTIGTPCIHLPETHEVVKLMRDLLDLVAPHVILLTETNVPHEENISYFGDGDEARMVYQFSLPPLLLHALAAGTSRYLRAWAARLPPPPAGCTFLNFTASHDGIGVRPLQGLVPAAELERLVQHVIARGGFVSNKKNPDGSESPYELNITYVDALGDPDTPDDAYPVDRFLCSQVIALAFKGVPAVYFNSLLAGRNNLEGVGLTGQPRSINRGKWTAAAIEHRLDDPASLSARVFKQYLHLLNVRRQHAAFHPDGAQSVLDLGDRAFGLERTAPDRREVVVCVSNVTGEALELPLRESSAALGSPGPWTDLLSGTSRGERGLLRLHPFETVWLCGQPPAS